MDTSSLREKSEEPVKFVLVGLSGVVVNYIVLFFCYDLLHLPETISVGTAILVSMTTNYIFNRIWTFHSANPFAREYGRYVLSNSAGALIQFGTTLMVNNLFKNRGFEGLDLVLLNVSTIYIATAIGIGLGFVTNFLFSKYFVFKAQTVS